MTRLADGLREGHTMQENGTKAWDWSPKHWTHLDNNMMQLEQSGSGEGALG